MKKLLLLGLLLVGFVGTSQQLGDHEDSVKYDLTGVEMDGYGRYVTRTYNTNYRTAYYFNNVSGICWAIETEYFSNNKPLVAIYQDLVRNMSSKYGSPDYREGQAVVWNLTHTRYDGYSSSAYIYIRASGDRVWFVVRYGTKTL